MELLSLVAERLGPEAALLANKMMHAGGVAPVRETPLGSSVPEAEAPVDQAGAALAKAQAALDAANASTGALGRQLPLPEPSRRGPNMPPPDTKYISNPHHIDTSPLVAQQQSYDRRRDVFNRASGASDRDHMDTLGESHSPPQLDVPRLCDSSETVCHSHPHRILMPEDISDSPISRKAQSDLELAV